MKTRSWVQKYSNKEQKDRLRKLTNDIKIIGISGTVGKTSVAELIYQYLGFVHIKAALMGTSGIKKNITDSVANFPCTSAPTKEYLCGFLIDCLELGIEYVVLETTVESTTVKVYENLDFEVIGVTNFLQNVVRSFKNDKEYFTLKMQLFKNTINKGLVLNERYIKPYDEYADFSNETLKNQKVFLYNRNQVNAFTNATGELSFIFNNETFTTSLLSSVNLDNVLCLFGILQALEMFDLYQVKRFLMQVTIPGRLEAFYLRGRNIVIDTGYNGISGVIPYFNESGFKTTHILLSTYFFDNDRDADPLTIMYRNNKGLYFWEQATGVLVVSPTCATKSNRRIPDESLAIKHLTQFLPQNSYQVFNNRIDALDAVWKASRPGDRIFITGMGSETYASKSGEGKPEDMVGDKEIIGFVAEQDFQNS